MRYFDTLVRVDKINRAQETELKIAEILGLMKPGALYDVPLLVERSGKSYRVVSRRLSLAVSRHKVERVRVGHGLMYRLISSSGAPRRSSATCVSSELHGWDASWEQFRALCESVRR